MVEEYKDGFDQLRQIAEVTANRYREEADGLAEQLALNGGPGSVLEEIARIGVASYKAVRVRVLFDQLIAGLQAAEIVVSSSPSPEIITEAARPVVIHRVRKASRATEGLDPSNLKYLGDFQSYNERNLVYRALQLNEHGEIAYPTLQGIRDAAFASWIRKLAERYNNDTVITITDRHMRTLFPLSGLKVYWMLHQPQPFSGIGYFGLSRVVNEIAQNSFCKDLDPAGVIRFLFRQDEDLFGTFTSLVNGDPLPSTTREMPLELKPDKQPKVGNIDLGLVEGDGIGVSTQVAELKLCEIHVISSLLSDSGVDGCCKLGFRKIDEEVLTAITRIKGETQGAASVLREDSMAAAQLFPKLLTIARDPMMTSIVNVSSHARKLIDLFEGVQAEGIRGLLAQGFTV